MDKLNYWVTLNDNIVDLNILLSLLVNFRQGCFHFVCADS